MGHEERLEVSRVLEHNDHKHFRERVSARDSLVKDVLDAVLDERDDDEAVHGLEVLGHEGVFGREGLFVVDVHVLLPVLLYLREGVQVTLLVF